MSAAAGRRSACKRPIPGVFRVRLAESSPSARVRDRLPEALDRVLGALGRTGLGARPRLRLGDERAQLGEQEPAGEPRRSSASIRSSRASTARASSIPERSRARLRSRPACANFVHSRGDRLPELRRGEPGAGALLLVVRHRARGGSGAARSARSSPSSSSTSSASPRRSERADPEDVRATIASVPRRAEARDRALRRHGREVRRRRGHGRVRRAGRPRGRSGAGSPRRRCGSSTAIERAERGTRRASSSRCAAAVNTGEAMVDARRTAARGRGHGRPATSSTPPPGCRARAGRRDRRRRGDVPRDRATSSSTRRSTPVTVKGKARALPVWRAMRRAAVSASTSSATPTPFDRPGRRARSCSRDVSSACCATHDAARDGHRRAGCRQDPARSPSSAAGWTTGPRSSSGGRAAASRTARASPSGRSARSSRRRQGSSSRTRPDEAARSSSAPSRVAAEDERDWLEARLGPLVGVGGAHGAPIGRSRSPPGGGSSRRRRAAAARPGLRGPPLG